MLMDYGQVVPQNTAWL